MFEASLKLAHQLIASLAIPAFHAFEQLDKHSRLCVRFGDAIILCGIDKVRAYAQRRGEFPTERVIRRTAHIATQCTVFSRK
jgi:hypothetical protein